MQLLDDFKENTGILNGSVGVIDQVAFDKLIDEHGIDFARGYLKAMQEMNAAIGNLMIRKHAEHYQVPESAACVYAKISNLHTALFKFLGDNNLDPDKKIRPVNHRTRIIGW